MYKLSDKCEVTQMKKLLFSMILLIGVIPVYAAELGEDGLHKQPWFTITFRDLREDLVTAREKGKRLALIIEQRGCGYCRKMHEEVFSDPEISKYISDNYLVVQYNMFGDEEVTDLNGEILNEKSAVRHWGYVFTPTIVFLPETAAEGQTVKEAAVMVMPGAFGKGTVLDMFQWVREKGYLKEEPFQKYHARKLEERAAAN
jgi:thioredoxin-related protein